MGNKKKASKRKQKPKSGKVIRVTKAVEEYIASRRRVGETWGQAAGRIITGKQSSADPVMWTLPSRLFISRREARNQALEEAARDGLALLDAEMPIPVCEADPQ